jgi:hypothetical protein
MSTSGHAETDGQTERIQRSIGEVLRMFVNENRDNWVKYLPKIEFALNDTIHSGTKFTPFYADMGRNPSKPSSMLAIGETDESETERAARLEHIEREVKHNLLAAQERMRRAADRNRREHDIVIGDYVWVEASYFGKGYKKPPKFESKRYGPYKVLGRTSTNTYKLEFPSSYRSHTNVNVKFLTKTPANTRITTILHPKTMPTAGNEYVVESIVDHKWMRGGKRWKFRVRWEGYQPCADTWEPLEHLYGAADVLLDYAHRHKLGNVVASLENVKTQPGKVAENPRLANIEVDDTVRRELFYDVNMDIPSWEDDLEPKSYANNRVPARAVEYYITHGTREQREAARRVQTSTQPQSPNTPSSSSSESSSDGSEESEQSSGSSEGQLSPHVNVSVGPTGGTHVVWDSDE